MPRHLSKTLAAEIATRTLDVVNPQNRAIALNASLRKHGFSLSSDPSPDDVLNRETLIAWLLRVYGPKNG